MERCLLCQCVARSIRRSVRHCTDQSDQKILSVFQSAYNNCFYCIFVFLLSTNHLVCRRDSYIHVSCSKMYGAVHLRFSITVSSTCIATDREALATSRTHINKQRQFKNSFSLLLHKTACCFFNCCQKIMRRSVHVRG